MGVISCTELQRPHLSFGLGWQEHSALKIPECINTGSRRAFFFFFSCALLSVSNQPCLFGQLPSSQVDQDTQKDTPCCIRMQRSAPTPLSALEIGTVQRGVTALDSHRFAAEMQGSDYGTWASSLPRAQKTPQPQAQNTCAATHSKSSDNHRLGSKRDLS